MLYKGDNMKNRILIIEDDNEISNMIADYLGRNGYETYIAKDGIRGIEYVIEKKPDLIILDIMLPYKSGDEVLREVREFSDIPIIVVSAKENVQFKVDLFKIGVDDYVVKPFDLSELLARVETNLRRYSKLTNQQTLYKYKNMDCQH